MDVTADPVNDSRFTVHDMKCHACAMRISVEKSKTGRDAEGLLLSAHHDDDNCPRCRGG